MASKPECHSDHRAVLQPRGAAFARQLTKAASMENYKAPDITPGAYSLSMIVAVICEIIPAIICWGGKK